MEKRGQLNELALFAGAGGGILAGHLLGWRTICAVERDAYAAQVLAQRQNDGIFQAFPIWSDVSTFDGRPWRGRVDVISGGFPCQDISVAGNGAGIQGERSGLWKEMARIIGEVRPRYAFIENSPALVNRGLSVVLSDLAKMGFDAKWGCLSAAQCGAPHRRDRIWILANANSMWESQPERIEQNQWGRVGNSCKELADTSSIHSQRKQPGSTNQKNWRIQGERPSGPCSHGDGWWATEPDVGRVADGVAFRVDRLKALGNGQVPRVAATAFDILGD